MTSMITRRGAIAGAAGLLGATATARAQVSVPPAPSLNADARQRGRRFGSAIAWGWPGADRGSIGNPAYAGLVAAQCGLVVAENELKWQYLRPRDGVFAFDHFDAMLAWAEAHGLAMRGHNLLWHRPKWMPAWVNAHDFGAHPAAEAERLLTTHIDTILKRYGTRIMSYDVVNETVEPSDGSLVETVFSKAMGGVEPVLDLAFHTARAAAPHAQLVYNDYMSWEPGNAQHRAGVLRLLEGFRKRGTPVDALGIQSHIATPGPDIAGAVRAQSGDWRQFLDAVSAMGYRMLITEFDVRDNNLPADPVARDRAVADYGRAYLDLTLSYPQVGDMLVWGLSDRYSWLDGFEPLPDGIRRRPCPYDDRFRPKPLRGAIAAALVTTATTAP